MSGKGAEKRPGVVDLGSFWVYIYLPRASRQCPRCRWESQWFQFNKNQFDRMNPWFLSTRGNWDPLSSNPKTGRVWACIDRSHPSWMSTCLLRGLCCLVLLSGSLSRSLRATRGIRFRRPIGFKGSMARLGPKKGDMDPHLMSTCRVPVAIYTSRNYCKIRLETTGEQVMISTTFAPCRPETSESGTSKCSETVGESKPKP